jgi:hypothetical protein
LAAANFETLQRVVHAGGSFLFCSVLFAYEFCEWLAFRAMPIPLQRNFSRSSDPIGRVARASTRSVLCKLKDQRIAHVTGKSSRLGSLVTSIEGTAAVSSKLQEELSEQRGSFVGNFLARPP